MERWLFLASSHVPSGRSTGPPFRALHGSHCHARMGSYLIDFNGTRQEKRS